MLDVWVSPSDQYGNTYAAGGTNEGTQMNRVAGYLVPALVRCGLSVGRSEDMYEGVREANRIGVRLYLALHSNAFDEPEGVAPVKGTRIFCYKFKKADGTETEAYIAAKIIFAKLAPITPGMSENIKENNLYETRVTYAPCVYIEVDFHDEPDVAAWIIDNVERIAEKICEGVCEYFGVAYIDPYDDDEEDESETVEDLRGVRYSILLGNWPDKESAKNANKHVGGNGVVGITVDGKVGELV